MKIISLFILVFYYSIALAQNGAIIIKDNVNIIMTNNANVILLQSSNQGITKSGNLLGGVICNNEQSRVVWRISTNTGNYIIPFKISNTLIPFSMNITSGGVGVGKVLISTYHTATNNTAYPNGNGYFSSVTNMNYNGVDNSANTVDRFWMINYNGYGTIPTSQFTMTYDAANDLNGIIENDLQAQYWSGTQWILPPTGVANPASDNVNSIPSISQNAPWVLVNKLIPLPIELISFDVICDTNKRLGIFKTLSEQNVDYFAIQSSTDAMFWGNTKIINATHNSNTLQTYLWFDDYSYEPTIYYRLEEHDYNGDITYYGIYSSTCDIISNIEIYPNPSYEDETVMVSGDVYSIEVYDMLGRKIECKIKDNKITGLSNGIYIIVVNNKIQTKLIIR